MHITKMIMSNEKVIPRKFCGNLSTFTTNVQFIRVWLMVFNTTFSNISVISWGQVLLMEETGVLEENHCPATSHWQTLSHKVVSSIPCHVMDVMKSTDWIISCKSNYHMITTTAAPSTVLGYQYS